MKWVFVVDDNREKLQSVADIMQEVFPSAQLLTRVSVSSIKSALIGACVDNPGDLLLVSDMTMPTYAGDRPEVDAGYNLLKWMKRRGMTYPVILVSSEEVDDDKAVSCYDNYLGSVVHDISYNQIPTYKELLSQYL